MTPAAVRRRLDDEAGFSLVELLVVMSLMIVIGGIVTSAIVSGLRRSEQGRQRVLALTDLERGAERLARDLRFADPVDSATTSAVTVNVLRDDGGSAVRHRVTFAASGGTITETRAIYDPPDAASPSTTIGPRALVEDLTSDAVFSLSTADGGAWTSGTDPLSDLAEIGIVLSRDLPTQDPIVLETSVFVRNVDDGR